MRTFAKITLAGTLLAGSAVAIGAAPATAAVTVSVSGTTITVTAGANETVGFGCSSAGKVLVNETATSPTLNCSALTKVTVTGGAGGQQVRGENLTAAAFSANPTLTATLGAGFDLVRETDQPDSIDLGGDGDVLELYAGGATNTLTDMGAGSGDFLYFHGTAGNDTISSASTGAANVIFSTVSGVTRSYSVGGVENVQIEGAAGNDTLSAAAISLASATSVSRLYGGDGDDTLTASPKASELYGDAGTNTLNGGAGDDSIWSASTTDVINPGAGGNEINDYASLHSGSRTLANTGANEWYSELSSGDTVARVRPGSTPGSKVVTSSLSRNGQQVLPSSVWSVNVDLYDKYEPIDRGLVDVVALGADARVSVTGDGESPELLDVTVPTGTWTVTGDLEDEYTIETNAAGLGDIDVSGLSVLSVHGSWSNANRGFVHRVTRDLVFRFPTAAVRNATATQLTAGTKTRAQVVSGLMNTDEYRGLDVDRVFVSFLRRPSDPSGRTYWINRLREGRTLLQFRAQLFGSNEYFTKAGGTNATYMVKAYNDVLGRQPDPAGKTYWTNKLNAGADRGAVAREFLASTEGRRNIVKDQFLRFLDRYPTSTESTTWVDDLAGATGEQQLIAFLAASNAYLTRT